MRFVLSELAKQVGKTPILENAWVLHYTEEVPDSHFKEYTIKQMSAVGANKEIKNWSQFERVHHIYHTLVGLGDQITKAIDADKTQSQISSLIKNVASE